MPPTVIVVGGAVAGTAVANALGMLGVPTLVLEKGAERDNSTRGDILHPPTLRFLERWGVLEALWADGALPITHIAVSQRERGRLATYDVPAQGSGPAARSIAMPHDRIEAVMLGCAERWPSVTVQRARVTGLLREADGRVVGVRAHAAGDEHEREREYRAPLVVACDGSQSLVRRELGIHVERHPYDHELLFIAAEGVTDPPDAMHFHLDSRGVIMVANRPLERMRIAIYFGRGTRGDLLKQPDPALYDYVVSRVPSLRGARFSRANAHIYTLVRQIADRFWAPGVALVGDAAHTTHPAGATGMNLAISGAARLADLLGPVLRDGSPASVVDVEIDEALAAFDAERRPAAGAAIEQNHQQALRIWQDGVQHDPDAYAMAANPVAGWGVGGAGWGQDPAGLGSAAPAELAT